MILGRGRGQFRVPGARPREHHMDTYTGDWFDRHLRCAIAGTGGLGFEEVMRLKLG